MLRPVTEYASDLGVFESVHELPLLSDKLAFVELMTLRRTKYDLVVLPAPATRWQYAAVAWAVGGKTTLVHRYGGLSSTIAQLTRMREVPLRGGHRFWENVRLIESIGLAAGEESYFVPESWRAERRDKNLLGMHTGSMSYKGNEQKRWPLESFAQIARRSIDKGMRVRAFFGPNETDDIGALQAQAPGVEIVSKPLADAARSLSECGVVLANDSGLAHLASGLGVTTLVIFGMTDPVRCRPVGPSIVIRPSSCPPCFDEGLRTFSCVRNLGYRCINGDVSVDYVEAALAAATSASQPPSNPIEREGELVLYGRTYA
jgi:heptosyltransferase-2